MWYQQPGKISSGFYMIGTAANPVYLCRSKNEWILIEGGIGLNAPLVLSQLQSILPDLSSLKHWFITHSHYDHCGAIEYLYPHFPCIKLYSSREAIINFRKTRYVQKVNQLNRSLAADQDIMHASQPAGGLAELPFIPADEDPLITTAGMVWQVIPTPGHSKCSLSFYNAPEKKLFVSDAFGEIVTTNKWFPLAFESMKIFMNSVSRLAELEVEFIALGHHGIIAGSDAASAASSCLQSCSEFIKELNEIIKTKGVSYAKPWIIETYQKKDNNFIPDDIYHKSIDQLLKVLLDENYLI
jgi:glyoxylase-like metal-dependent hydrolase (beta-lactamase superfamily II)